MMLGLSLDFINGGYSLNSPTALWWTQLASAVVFGLGTATVLTLVITPSLLALRVWLETGAYRGGARLAALSFGATSAAARDLALNRAMRKMKPSEIVWEAPPAAPVASPKGGELGALADASQDPTPLRAAE